MKRKEKIILTIVSLILILFTLILSRNYIKFENNKLNIKVNETKEVKIKTNISNYYCTSSNEEIVRVLNICDLYGVAEGKATITVKGGNLTDKMKVTVGNIINEYFEFNESTINIKIGENHKISYNTNIDNITLNTSNDNIVIKDNIVYGLKKGTSKITFKHNNIIKEINVNILEDEYFEFNESTINIKIGDNHKISYNTNIDNVILNTSNDNIVIKDNIVYANKSGKTIITFKNKKMTVNIKPITIEVTYDKSSSIGLTKYKDSCTINTINTSCEITLPYINQSKEYNVIGFKKDNQIYIQGTKISVNKNETFTAYVEAKDKISINYYGNGSNLTKTSDSCYGSTCTITLPNASRANYEVLGYSASPTYTFAQYKIGETITINKNIDLYVITRKKLYATFLNDNNVKITKPSTYEESNNAIKTYCYVYNNLEGCYINAPSNITINDNYEFIGFRGDKEYTLNSKIYLKQNQVFSSIYKQKEVVSKDITIYVSTKGNDNNNGLTLSSAVKTLNQVQKILKSKTNIKNVYVKIEPGTYYNEHTIWNYYNGYNIRFMSTSEIKPVYKGDNKTLPWFSISVNNNNLVDLKISFYNIKVESYYSGISIIGGPGKVKGITIENMLFNSIGTKNIDTPYISKECINIKNALNVSVINNTFTNLLNNSNNLENHTITSIRLYNTSNSLIKGNKMTNVDGSGIILENASNNNLIQNNTFTLTGYLSFITENYYSYYNICSNNTVSNNNFVSGFSGYKVLKTCIIENGSTKTLYYNEDFTNSNKNLYANLGYKLVRKNYTDRFKIN